MIVHVKKKLTITFLSSLLLLTAITLLITYTSIEWNIKKTAIDHLQLNFEVEFLPHYQKKDFDTLGKIIEDELFQVFNKFGDKLHSVQSIVTFDPMISLTMLKEVLRRQKSMYVFFDNEGYRYLIYYVPLHDGNVCRIISSMEERYQIKIGYLSTMFVYLPILLGLSFFLTFFLVRKALEPIFRLFTLQETFSSNITHELNSPLTSIKGTLEVSLRKDRTTSEYRQSAKSTLKNVMRIISLLNNLYLLSTANFKPLQLSLVKIDIAEFINEAVENIEPIVFAKGIKINTDINSEVACVGDPALLNRAIENILENASNYTPENGYIYIKVFNENQYCIITVSNTCSEVSEPDLNNLFKPFYRLENEENEKSKGAGLGLFIVKYIVESHEGEISFSQNANVISLTISLPV